MDRILKRPKVEDEEEANKGSREEQSEQEEALMALIEHRTKEVEHVKQKISYYQSQLEQAERRLSDSQSKLARLHSRDSLTGSKKGLEDSSRNVKEEPKTPSRNVKEEPKSPSPVSNEEGSSRKLPQARLHEGLTGSKRGLEDTSRNVKEEPKSPSLVSKGEASSRKQPQARPQLIIPAVNPKISQPVKLTESNVRPSVGSGSRASVSMPTQSNGAVRIKEESPCRPSAERDSVAVQAKGTKRKFEQKEHKELISLIRSGSSPCMIRCQPGVHISSQHKRKLRCLALCPSNDQLFSTSSLDGIVNLWQVHGKGTGASLLSSTDCVSKQRRWPEDIAWHPQGDKLFCVYTADAGDSQISILNLNTTQKGKRVTYLDEKPHVKGIINNIAFMPWADTCFVTGGSDHAVIFWNEKDDENSWKYKALHRNMHSSAVMGVAGLQQKSIVLSVGADKRIIGFDMSVGRADFKHQLDCKCMSVVPNPSDFNLFMVQTGTHERQLRLFDIRLRQTEIHSFGWKQESSESQSALINQAWSPDGLYISSGSADPIIHIFDIRYNSHKPSQSIKAHQKRVFKAAWMQAPPLLISISSDLNIGLHKIT